MHNNVERMDRAVDSNKSSTNSDLFNQVRGDMHLNSTPMSAGNVAHKEDAMFGKQGGFCFGKVEDIYKLPADEAKLVEQMKSVLANRDRMGTGVTGTEYGGAIGYGIDGKVHETRVYSNHVEVGDGKDSPNFGKGMVDLTMQGAWTKETWQTKPNVSGKDDPNVFSKQDIERADVLGLKSYVLTPANAVMEYDGSAQHVYKDSDRTGKLFGMFDDAGNFWKSNERK